MRVVQHASWSIEGLNAEKFGGEMVEHKGEMYPMELRKHFSEVGVQCKNFLNSLAGAGDREEFFHDWIVEELIMNAFKHGNNSEVSRKIIVKLRVVETAKESRRSIRTILSVSDEGQTFDPKEVPDATTDENVELDTGRGIQAALGLARKWYKRAQLNVAVDMDIRSGGSETGKRVTFAWTRNFEETPHHVEGGSQSE